MDKRGRPSAGDLAAKARVATVVAGDFGRAPPPEGMAEDQALIWRQIVATEPVEFFATAATKGLLRDYCRHRSTTDKLSAIIELFQADWLKAKDGVKRYADLCKVRDAECRAAADKAVKLRLTNQSRWTPEKSGTAARHELKLETKPWEILRMISGLPSRTRSAWSLSSAVSLTSSSPVPRQAISAGEKLAQRQAAFGTSRQWV